MHARRPETFDFAGFTLLPRERLLLDGASAVPLTGRAFDLLVALVRRAGSLAHKDELLDEVWAGLTVEEVNLSVNISLLRKALGQRRPGERMIETVAKTGYRFVCPVRPRLGAPSYPTPLDAPSGQGRAPASPQARRAYLEGRYDWNRRSEEGLTAAIASFRRAVAEDPDFALAYAGLADCYAALDYLSHRAPAESFPMARGYAEMALERDPTLAEPHASLAYVKFYFDWDWAAADAAYRTALARQPEWAAAHQWYSILLLAVGRPHAAIAEIMTACEREPLSLSINTDLGFHYYSTPRRPSNCNRSWRCNPISRRRSSGSGAHIRNLASVMPRSRHSAPSRRRHPNGRSRLRRAALSRGWRAAARRRLPHSLSCTGSLVAALLRPMALLW